MRIQYNLFLRFFLSRTNCEIQYLCNLRRAFGDLFGLYFVTLLKTQNFQYGDELCQEGENGVLIPLAFLPHKLN